MGHFSRQAGNCRENAVATHARGRSRPSGKWRFDRASVGVARVKTFRWFSARPEVSLGLSLMAQATLGSAALCQQLTGADRDWAASLFGGVLTENSFVNSLYSVNPRLADDYLVGTDVTYTYYRLQRLPIDLELDVTGAKRFGIDHQWDFGIIPMVRWKEFPWNNYVYTNFRIGLVGVDYVTGISPWELHWAGNDHGSRFLNYLALEVDFRPSADSQFEWYVGSHHRSGAWGTIDGTYGGSTYMTTGLRYHF
jgi:hypothetical protein